MIRIQGKFLKFRIFIETCFVSSCPGICCRKSSVGCWEEWVFLSVGGMSYRWLLGPFDLWCHLILVFFPPWLICFCFESRSCAMVSVCTSGSRTRSPPAPPAKCWDYSHITVPNSSYCFYSACPQGFAFVYDTDKKTNHLLNKHFRFFSSTFLTCLTVFAKHFSTVLKSFY